MPELTLDAWIVDGRVRHHRARDHFGSEDSRSVALSERIGPYEEQTPVHHVLLDLVARIGRLEAGVIQRSSFTLDSWITDNLLTIDAVIQVLVTRSLTIDAQIIRGGSLTIDAQIVAMRGLTIDAMIVWGDA